MGKMKQKQRPLSEQKETIEGATARLQGGT